MRRLTPDNVLKLAGIALAGALIADLLSPRNAHLPVCAHEAYWREKAERRGN